MKIVTTWLFIIYFLLTAQTAFADLRFEDQSLAPKSFFSSDEDPSDLSQNKPDRRHGKNTQLKVAIEHADINDLDDLPYNPGYSIDRKVWTENISSGVSLFKAVYDNKLAGLIMFEPNYEQQVVVVYGLEVNEQFNRKGIGRLLLLQAVYESLQNDFDGKIALIPSDLAREFYYKIGFDLARPNGEWILLDEDKALSLVKSLSERLQIQDKSFEDISPLDENELKILVNGGQINFLTRTVDNALTEEQNALLKKLILTYYPGKKALKALNEIIDNPRFMIDLYDRVINQVYLSDFPDISA